MVNTIHQGLQVRAGGASRAEVEQMLQNLDANHDGEISPQELQSLADQGRARGFADQDSLELFNAGLDAGGLAEVKSREPGQQFSKDYMDKTMKPLLEKTYGKNGTAGADIVAPQASRELTQDGAESLKKATYEPTQRAAIGQVLGNKAILLGKKDGTVDPQDRVLTPNGNGGFDWKPIGQKTADQINETAGSKFDDTQKKAVQQVLGDKATLLDVNRDGHIDAKDKALLPNASGGTEWQEIGQKRADQINEVAGLARGRKILEGGPYFPNSPGNPDWANGKAKQEWMGGPGNDTWKAEPIPKGQPGAGDVEYKLDTSKMSASQALDDMAKNPKNYCMDCAMGKQVVQYQRVREMLGDDKFNELAAKHGMTIGHSDAAYRSGLLSKMTDKADGGTVNMPLDQYKDGWQGYAKVLSVGNKDVQKQLEAGGWSGEHFTVNTNEKGERVVTAHPFGTVPLKDFDGMLRDRLVADSHGKIKREDIKIRYSEPLESDVDYARTKL
jgi:hypothetical protein